MADKDFSRLAVERALQMVERTRAVVKARMPYGPNKVAMTPTELRKFLVKLDQPAKEKLRATVGPDEWDMLMTRLYGGANGST